MLAHKKVFIRCGWVIGSTTLPFMINKKPNFPIAHLIKQHLTNNIKVCNEQWKYSKVRFEVQCLFKACENLVWKFLLRTHITTLNMSISESYTRHFKQYIQI